MTETCSEYIKRMQESSQAYSSDVFWQIRKVDCQLALRIFMAIKDQCVYKKLAGDPKQMANGQEIREAVTGETVSYASYWLRRNEVVRAFEQLRDAGVIIHRVRNSGPYGYGDDEEYYLSAMGSVLITECRTNDLIKRCLYNMINKPRLPMNRRN